jgi:FkbM family methyltransferase
MLSRLRAAIRANPIVGSLALRIYRAAVRARTHPLLVHKSRHVRKVYASGNSPRRVAGGLFLEHFRHQIRINAESVDLTAGIALARFGEVDYFMHATPGNLIESFVLIDGAWEPHILNLVVMLLKRTSGTVIDVGANIGATTIPLAATFPQRNFHCFEPHPAVYQRLAENVRLNAADNIETHNLAVAAESGVLDFFAQDESDNMGLSSLTLNDDIERHHVIKVKVTALDEIFRNRTVPVALIKIDVQGLELSVLRGALQILTRDKPYVVFEYEDMNFKTDAERRSTKAAVLEFFSNLGYELYAVPDPHFSFMPKITFEGPFSGDVVAFPPRTGKSPASG